MKSCLLERDGILLLWCLKNSQEPWVMVTSADVWVVWKSYTLNRSRSKARGTGIYKELWNMERCIQRELWV